MGGIATGGGGTDEPIDPCNYENDCGGGTYASIAGDVPGTLVFDSGRDSWIAIQVRETNFQDEYQGGHATRRHPRIEIILESPPGVDYDLSVECGWCFGFPLETGVRSLTGHSESLTAYRNDTTGSPPFGAGEDNSFEVMVSVRLHQATTDQCIPWTLTIRAGGDPGETGQIECYFG